MHFVVHLRQWPILFLKLRDYDSRLSNVSIHTVVMIFEHPIKYIMMDSHINNVFWSF